MVQIIHSTEIQNLRGKPAGVAEVEYKKAAQNGETETTETEIDVRGKGRTATATPKSAPAM